MLAPCHPMRWLAVALMAACVAAAPPRGAIATRERSGADTVPRWREAISRQGARTTCLTYTISDVRTGGLARAFGDPRPLLTPRYSVTDLGALWRRAGQGPLAINDAGAVVGTLPRPEGGQAAFLYQNGRRTEMASADYRETEPSSLNNHGQAVGHATRSDGRRVAFLWEHGKLREILPFPIPPGFDVPDFSHSPVRINDEGQVIGVTAGGFWWTGYLWQGGQVTPLTLNEAAAPPGARAGALSGPFEPRAINNKGQVVGLTVAGPTGRLQQRTVWWEKGEGHVLKVPDDKSVLVPNALNDQGQVVGYWLRAGELGRAALWQNGRVTILADIGGPDSQAYAVNKQGQVVGSATTMGAADYGSRAVLWQEGKMMVLNELIPSASGWVLTAAHAINGQGQITGIGYRNGGVPHAYLLTPAGLGDHPTARW